MKRLIEFLFFRWERKVVNRGTESWFSIDATTGLRAGHNYTRDYVDYKLTNKFDGSEKIKRVYLN